jgi:hypothetical protein
MRRMLYTAAALVFGVGVPLLVLTEYTDAVFAWTVAPPLTASFLGGCYWSAGVLEFLAARERTWARARAAVPGVLLFTVLTCILTAVNLRHFNLKNPAAYAWIAVYFSVPPILSWIWWRQTRIPGPDEPRRNPLPGWLRASYAGSAALLLVMGLFQVLAPRLAPWPWDLDPPDSAYANLTRMGPYIGVWLLGLGTVAAQAVFENDLGRIRAVVASGIVLPVLQGVALARYPGTVRWSSPAAWGFIAFLSIFLAVNIAAWRTIRARERTQPAHRIPV